MRATLKFPQRRALSRVYVFTLSLLSLLPLSLFSSVGSVYAQRSFDDPEVRDALQALRREPTIQAVHRAALEFYNASPDQVSSMRTRARYKALLPDVHVRYRYSENGVRINKFDYIQFAGEQAGLDDSDGNVNEIQVSGSWSLSRLLFNPEVLDVSSLAALQEGVLKEVTRLYYTRRRLQIDLIISDPRDPATRLSKELRIEQLTATLDALTNNLFARSVPTETRVTRDDHRWGSRSGRDSR